MSFLDKVGKDALTALRFAAPLLTTFGAAEVSQPLSVIAGLVTAAEGIGTQLQASGGSKLDKLALVLPEAVSALKQSQLLKGKVVADESKFTAAATGIVNALVDLLKAVDTSGSAPTPVTPAPAKA